MKKSIYKNLVARQRIQGTDGIRSEARRWLPGDGPDPLRTFFEKNVITDRFVEFYVYVWASKIFESSGKSSCEIVVGWDPRDVEGIFSRAAIRGIRKAGGCALVAGIVPTPLVPMVIIARRALGGIMVTASHNPKDQNGVKLFTGPGGMKLLPDDDRILTKALIHADPKRVLRAKQNGTQRNIRAEALELFSRFTLDSKNSWCENISFKDVFLVVDPANGSYAGIAARLFRQAGFGKVLEINGKLDGNVNLLSGVADLEGHGEITADMIIKGAGLFYRHKLALKLFELGRKHLRTIRSGNLRVCGAVFDADGDRFYMTEYDPFKDRLIVLSGDETATHQARFMSRGSRRGLFINTVESDLNASQAIRKLGFDVRLTAVGDKWILARILLVSLCRRARTLVSLAAKAKGGTRKTAESLFKSIRALKKTGVTGIGRIQRFDFQLEKLERSLKASPDAGLPGVIGCEETGHNITAGRLENGTLVFCGNGLKSAFNTLVETQHLRYRKSVTGFYKLLEMPFCKGFKKTDYTYYVLKHLFHHGSAAWNKVKKEVNKEARNQDWRCRTVAFPDDPDMLYFSLSDRMEKRSDILAAVFVRNSGTENKVGVNLRGPKSATKKLCLIGERIVRLLILEMKDFPNPWAISEFFLLSQLKYGPLQESCMNMDAERLPRLLSEMKKQDLIYPGPDGYCLTPRGKWVTINSPKTGRMP